MAVYSLFLPQINQVVKTFLQRGAHNATTAPSTATTTAISACGPASRTSAPAASPRPAISPAAASVAVVGHLIAVVLGDEVLVDGAEEEELGEVQVAESASRSRAS